MSFKSRDDKNLKANVQEKPFGEEEVMDPTLEATSVPIGVVTGCGVLIVRDEPQGKEIGKLHEGAEVEVHQLNGPWARIRCYGPSSPEPIENGWVMYDYLKMI